MLESKILVVDDDAIIHKIINLCLVREGYLSYHAYSGEKAYKMMDTIKPDLILLDLVLPGEDGVQICQTIRRNSNIPIIFITGKNNLFDMAMCFGAGGDDYIVKPFRQEELVLRVKTHLRRYANLMMQSKANEVESVLKFSNMTIDLGKRAVEVKGKEVALTAKEFDLLVILAKSHDKYFSTNQLIELLWSGDNSADSRALMAHMSKLRKKLGDIDEKPIILNVRNVGYKFSLPVAEQ